MARTKTVTVGGTDYQLQSVTYSWYSNLTDLYINPANGRKNTAKYVDALIKGCVTAPAEVAKGGLKYFDEQDDLATPSELNPKTAERRARNNERLWRMVFCMSGISYSELKAMDLFDFAEAEQARILWQTEWNKKD